MVGELDKTASCLLIVITIVTGELYPYGDSTHLTISSPATRVGISQGHTFPFFGQRYNAFYVSIDGLIGFSQHVKYSDKEFSDRVQKISNAAEDYPFVAPFHYNAVDLTSVLEGGRQYSGKIYYKTLVKSNQNKENGELQNITRFINDAVIGVENFLPQIALIVTWENVSDFRQKSVVKCTDKPGKICKKSTFQAALVSDGKLSFAIFNYLKMEVPMINTYQAGFNGGSGRGWVKALAMGELERAAQLKGSDMTGRYIYQINEERILVGGCRDPSNQYAAKSLQITPNFAGMLGGEMVEISGPCFKSIHKISLRFGDSHDMYTTTKSCYIMDTKTLMKAKCEVPMLTQTGEVTVALSQNDGYNFVYKTTLTIVHPSRMPKKSRVQLKDYGWMKKWAEQDASMLTMTWDPKLLSKNMNADVNISVIGYKDNVNKKGEWKHLAYLNNGASKKVDSSAFTFSVNDVMCDEECMTYETGIVEVRLLDLRNADTHRAIQSKVIPLGWLINKDMVERYGTQWPNAKCMAWYEVEKTQMSWMEDLEFCPCTLQQVLSDFSRWQKDGGCNLYSTSQNNCKHHSDAVHCARNVQPTKNVGAGNQCCYNRKGLLLYSADTYKGSTPDKSHDWGAAPYVKAGHVPSLSHWVRDIVPLFYCCVWTNYSSCDYYMDVRATKDCTGYFPPKHAMVFGQGNVETFDGNYYQVCGEGDFILLKSADVTIEGRFLKSPFNKRNKNSLILTDVGVRVKEDVIEIRLKGPEMDRSKRTLDVVVNGGYQYFDIGPLRWRDFKEFSVVNSDNPSNTRESNLTVIVKNGIGIQVAEDNNMLNLIVMIPPKIKSGGLLGSWNNNKTDDLRPRNSMKSIANSNPAQIYSQFIMTWAIAEKDSSIVPFPVLARNVTDMCKYINQNNSFCNENQACNYDLWATGNVSLASKTRQLSTWFQQLQQDVKLVKTCGLLNVPRSQKDNYNYTLGSTVSITGCKTGQLSGDTSYTCSETNSGSVEWTPRVTASCQGSSQKFDIGMIVGIVVAVVVALVIIMAVGVLCKCRRSSKGTKTDEKSDNQYSVVSTKEPKSDDDGVTSEEHV